jgi:hypothetical protein
MLNGARLEPSDLIFFMRKNNLKVSDTIDKKEMMDLLIVCQLDDGGWVSLDKAMELNRLLPVKEWKRARITTMERWLSNNGRGQYNDTEEAQSQTKVDVISKPESKTGFEQKRSEFVDSQKSQALLVGNIMQEIFKYLPKSDSTALLDTKQPSLDIQEPYPILDLATIAKPGLICIIGARGSGIETLAHNLLEKAETPYKRRGLLIQPTAEAFVCHSGRIPTAYIHDEFNEEHFKQLYLYCSKSPQPMFVFLDSLASDKRAYQSEFLHTALTESVANKWLSICLCQYHLDIPQAVKKACNWILISPSDCDSIRKGQLKLANEEDRTRLRPIFDHAFRTKQFVAIPCNRAKNEPITFALVKPAMHEPASIIQDDWQRWSDVAVDEGKLVSHLDPDARNKPIPVVGKAVAVPPEWQILMNPSIITVHQPTSPLPPIPTIAASLPSAPTVTPPLPPVPTGAPPPLPSGAPPPLPPLPAIISAPIRNLPSQPSPPLFPCRYCGTYPNAPSHLPQAVALKRHFQFDCPALSTDGHPAAIPIVYASGPKPVAPSVPPIPVMLEKEPSQPATKPTVPQKGNESAPPSVPAAYRIYDTKHASVETKSTIVAPQVKQSVPCSTSQAFLCDSGLSLDGICPACEQPVKSHKSAVDEEVTEPIPVADCQCTFCETIVRSVPYSVADKVYRFKCRCYVEKTKQSILDHKPRFTHRKEDIAGTGSFQFGCTISSPTIK